MRADDDIYLTLGQIFLYTIGILSGTCSRQVIHRYRHVFQSVAERTEMLIGQYRSRHQHSHLLAIHSGLKGCTYCHLGLTKAHIAAYQSVHGSCLLHIGLHILRSLQLIGRVLIQERCLQFVLQI